jgi:osmotically-inducible protein OsmY
LFNAKAEGAASHSSPTSAGSSSGCLTLTGAVKNPSQRTAAESAVSGLTGVRNIKNEIGYVFDVDPPT